MFKKFLKLFFPTFVEPAKKEEPKLDPRSFTMHYDEKGKLAAGPKPERARDEKGRLVADNAKTPTINEAWVGGKAPAKKAPSKKKAAPKKRGRPAKAKK